MNGIYDIARHSFAIANVDWRAIEAFLIAWGSVPDFNPADDTVADIKARGNTELARSLAITSKSVAATGAMQTNNVVIPGVAPGPTIRWFTMCYAGATDALTMPLLFIDDAEDLPFECNGLDVIVQPNWAEARSWGRL